MHRAHHGGAFDQVVAREREDAPLRHALDGVAGAADALQEGRDAVRRRDLADQVDVADVDAELERRGGHQHLQLALAELFFGLEPRFLRQAAVVRGDVLGAEALGELVRHALGQAPRVDRDQRGAMRLDQRDQPVVDLLPHLVRHHRLERRAAAPRRPGPAAACGPCPRSAQGSLGQKARNFLDRLLRGRKADALQLAAANVVEALERQRQVRAAARLQHGVDLVDDHHPRGLQHRARALGGEQEVQRLGRGDQDVRRRAQHRRALGLRRVAAAHRRGDLDRRDSAWISRRGTARFLWMSAESAFSGET